MSKRAAMVLITVAVLLGVTRGSNTLSAQGGGVSPQAAVTPLLQYQGRLSDPDTGEPVADGVYEISFRLYNAEGGGASLWTETEDVPVQGGLFSNTLGDSTPLSLALFNGQALWLGIKVGADAEAVPRQPVLPVAYALSLVPGAVVGGPIQVAGNLDVTGSLTGPHAGDPDAHHVRYTNTEAWNAVLASDGPGSGLNADLLDGLSSTSFALSSHLHDGEDIQGGTIHEKYIDPAVARDTEVTGAIATHSSNVSAHHTRYTNTEAFSAVLSLDGPGSGLNADYLDSYDSAALFALGENETVTGRPSFNGGTPGSTPPFYVDSTYPVSNLNADYLDGYDVSALLNRMAAACTTSIYGSITANTPTLMDSFTVTPPGAGTITVIVMGSAFLDCDATSTSSRLCQDTFAGICDTANSSSTCGSSWRRYWFEDPDNATSQNEEHWITVARTVSVGTGSRVFYLNGQSHVSGMQWVISGDVLAIYAPNSMSVTNP